MDNAEGKNSALGELGDFLYLIRKANAEDYNRQVRVYLDGLLGDQRAGILSAELGDIFFTCSLTDSGINSNRGFFPELRQRIKYRILPPVNEDNFFSHVVLQLFSTKEGYLLLERLSDENWERLIAIAAALPDTIAILRAQLENALIILTHQFISIGIDPYLIKKLPSTDDTDSPFFQLNLHMNEYLQQSRHITVGELGTDLQVCDGVFDYLKENRANIGISLHLTFLIRRAEQHSHRIGLLLRIYSSSTIRERLPLLKELTVSVVRGELHSNSLLYFISENTGLLANRIANQTSSKGGNYIGFTKQENRKLLFSAMGGGFVVIVLVYIKHFIHLLHLPLLPEGILFGLNYGLGFVFMHFMHFTLATKQPAMTASYIAESIEQKGIGKESRKELSVILAQIIRSQFISLIGNLVVVLPLCFLSAWALLKLAWIHVFSEPEAQAYLTGNHPLLSGSLFYAFFTGIFLTLAGLITGYYDNKVVFSLIPMRVTKHPFLKRILKPKLLEKFAGAVSNNLGAVVGNLSLGMFLGLAGNFGKFTGLPFDIRHVTISAGNVAISESQGYGFSSLFVSTVFLGVILIGLINILSSFMFSFLIACRSRYLTTRQTWLVLGGLVRYILRNPKILLLRKDKVEQE